jgi:calcium-dependent protein kinase
VRKCVNRSGMTRAVKIIDKQAMEQEHRQRLETEILIMQHMDHPNVCRLFEVFEEGRYYYLVMEYCANGELYDELRNAGCFSEHMAADLIDQVLRAVSYCHSRGVVHRDIKPENVLIDKELIEGQTFCKIIDFDNSSPIDEGQLLQGVFGTVFYVAPEVISKQPYDERCDVWSVGVIMYIMLTG